MENLSSSLKVDFTPANSMSHNENHSPQVVDQANDANNSHKIANDTHSLKVELPEKKFESDANPYSASQESQSTNISPIRLNFLVETPSGLLKNSPGGFEDSHSLTIGQLDSEAVDASNINSRISQILTEPKQESDQNEQTEKPMIVIQPPLLNLNFSLGADFGFEASEPKVEPQQTYFRRKRKTNKNPSRVTFDDSLNVDIIYDPEVPSDQFIKIEKSSEAAKKPEFISVYANRSPKNEEDKENKALDSFKEKRKHDLSIEYRPESLQNDNSDAEQNNLFEGVNNSPDSSELRLSKMSEDQAAKLFEARKNDIFEGLKKLNKNRPYNNLPKSPPNQVFSNNRRLNGKIEGKKSLSQSYDENQMKSRVTGLIVENVESRRPKSSQRSERKSLTPQKTVKSSNTMSPEKKIEPLTFSIDLNKRGRSLSDQMVKPFDSLSAGASSSENQAKNAKMMEEIYQLAKQDVQKRIASIDKRLIENPDSPKKSSERAIVEEVPQPVQVSQIVNHVLSPKQAYRESANITRKSADLTPEIKPEKKRINSGQYKKEDLQPKDNKLSASKFKTTILDTGVEKQKIKNNSFSVASTDNRDPYKPQNEKIDKMTSPGKYVTTLESQMNQKNARPTNKLYLNYDNRQAASKPSASKKMFNSPTKFSELEAVISQRNSYTRMHSEKAKVGLTSPKAFEKQEIDRIDNQGVKKVQFYTAAEVAKQYTDIKKNLYFSTLNKLSSNRQNAAQDSQKDRLSNKPDEIKMNNYEKREALEVKQYSLRQQPPEKASHRKNNSNIVSSSKFSNMQNQSNISQDEILNKPVKAGLQSELDKYLSVPSSKDNKIPRSSSANSMKIVKQNQSPKQQPDNLQARKTPVNDPPYDISGKSPKSSKPTNSVLSPNRPMDSNKNEKSHRTLVSPSQKASVQNIVFDSSRGGSSKPEYLKSLFYSASKDGGSKEKSKVQKSRLNKSSCVGATSSGDNMEEMLSKNYKFLEIRNNQYVFLNN